MQQPTRYYITKSGDEPTVRSVKVALGAALEDDRAELRSTTLDAAPNSIQDEAVAINGVKRIVREAMRKRARLT